MKSLLTILFLFASLSVQAKVLSGEDFLKMCSVPEEQEASTYTAICTGYIAGVYEAYVSFNQWELIADTLCPPDNVSPVQMTDRVVTFVTQLPDYETKPAGGMVLNALADSYPCE